MNDKTTSPLPIILIMIPQYLPGNKAGGTVRSVANMVDRLGDEFKFYIITSDRDLGEKKAYPGIQHDQWVQVSKARVMYLSVQQQTIIGIYKLLKKTNYDILFLTGIFSKIYSMCPIGLARIGFLNNAPILISPEGEVSPGALQIKFCRKRVFLSLAKTIGLYQNIYWKVSSSFEKEDLIKSLTVNDNTVRPIINISSTVHHTFKNGDVNSVVFTIPDLPSAFNHPEENQRVLFREKKIGNLRIIFLSRIARKKNLAGALALLRDVPGDIQFDIYGPIEDINYWNECKAIIKGLQSNIKIEYRGEVEHDKVHSTFEKYHLFFFPTFSENYGHVIVEALVSGCPVLISDQTFWRNLEKMGVGWDVSLDNSRLFRDVLQRCINMDSTDFQNISQKAMQYGIDNINEPSSVNEYRRMFRAIMESKACS